MYKNTHMHCVLPGAGSLCVAYPIMSGKIVYTEYLPTFYLILICVHVSNTYLFTVVKGFYKQLVTGRNSNFSSSAVVFADVHDAGLSVKIGYEIRLAAIITAPATANTTAH